MDGEEPRLGQKASAYVVEKTGIGYVDELSGVPDWTANYGYVTVCTYLYLIDQGTLKLEDVHEKIKLHFTCGGLLYSSIPDAYDLALGMTGTLDCLSDEQNDLLKMYGFNTKTILPTTFKRKPESALNFRQFQRDPGYQVFLLKSGSWDEYFTMVITEIRQEMNDGRAILVFFESQWHLERFHEHMKKRVVKLTKAPLLLGDRDQTLQERQATITQAVRAFTFTLVTQSYGRGTDFVCQNENLERYNGVHLIITFMPPNASQRTQFLGRTNRQGNQGSARFMMWEDDLKYLGATELEKNSEEWAHTSLDEYLTFKAKELEAARYKQMRESHVMNEKIHKDTVTACSHAVAGQYVQAAEKFQSVMQQSNKQQASSINSVDVCFLMDCTGSMSRWIKACQDRIVEIAEYLKNAVEEQSPTATIRMAFVAYRDFEPKGEGWKAEYDGLVKFDFTEDIEAMKKCVRSQSASGGDDGPEDICGGLEKVKELHWQADLKHVFHIADAPCHGGKYHSCRDNFEDGDPKGRVPELQLEELLGDGSDSFNKIVFSFIKIGSETDRMLTVWNNYLRTVALKPIRVIDLSDADSETVDQEFAAAVEAAVVKEIVAHSK
mmetsp:Transcript_7798/g.12403  ORF Transcript_7798/g.12403 Transcript_7798/m.12403 type:complete len:607 (+) Transcript_7798:2-1822(+)